MKITSLILLLPLFFFPFFVINSTNPIYSAITLACTFLFSGILLFSINCNFLGFVFILVYVGAIAVFFLLVIMMLQIKVNSKMPVNFVKYGPLSYFLAIIFVFEIFYPIWDLNSLDLYNFNFHTHSTFFSIPKFIVDVKIFGSVLYTHFLVYFLMAGFILFISLIGSLTLLIYNDEKNQIEISNKPFISKVNKFKINYSQIFQNIFFK